MFLPSNMLKLALVDMAIVNALQWAAFDDSDVSGHPERPRMLVMRGNCDGSNVIMAVANGLLEMHGVSVKKQKDGDGDILTPKSEFFEKANKSLAMAIELANDDAHLQNQSLTFKLTTGLNLHSVWMHTKEDLKKLGTRSVIGFRENTLDTIVCQMKHCSTERYHGIGYLVGSNGKNRTEDCEIEESSDQAKHFEYRQGDMSVLDVKKLIRAIDQEEEFVEEARKTLRVTGFHYGEVESEKLLGYASNHSRDVDMDAAVEEWSKFLKAWGVEPVEADIKRHLRNHGTINQIQKDGDLWRTPLQWDTIQNFGEVKKALEAAGPQYSKFLRGYKMLR